MLTDPIADMLTRVRNANTAMHDEVPMPSSKQKVALADVLQREGYIVGYEVAPSPKGVGEILTIKMKYSPDRDRTISGLRRISTPGLRVYRKADSLPRVLGGLGVAVLSTSGERRLLMSRIGQAPITIPAGVDVTIEGRVVKVRGPKGELTRTVPATISVQKVDHELHVSRPNDERENRALHGLTRSLVNNMVIGVTDGFRKNLEIVGVGYRAEAQGPDAIRLALGFSHPVNVKAPEGITFEVPAVTQIVVSGIDKEVVGQVAADIRSIRKPEPYKGKGVRYQGERVLRKAGKAGKK
jgi:large subunit ribosomal protein L6